MRLREYTATVILSTTQTVTFVVDVDALPPGGLVDVAVAHCHPDKWAASGHRTSTLVSKEVPA
jgi:hypothetical protein